MSESKPTARNLSNASAFALLCFANSAIIASVLKRGKVFEFPKRGIGFAKLVARGEGADRLVDFAAVAACGGHAIDRLLDFVSETAGDRLFVSGEIG
ncbi:MAG: hypothetical protein WDN44_13605 [Sphingomonas sp.]